jgi:2-polyprenyl-6-methoxyphenol hydroxylase-like FAD-dependent oxidoreductase
MKVAIMGAGLAGPTLAWWLNRTGHTVTLVEAAPVPRTGGYVVDFWGVGYTIAERMGLLPAILDAGYAVQEVRVVGADGRRVAGFPGDTLRRAVAGRVTSVPRDDLARILLDSVRDDVEVVFGDVATALEADGDQVRLGFRHGPARTFDLVAGADGLHSGVRRLAFGPEDAFEAFLGYHVAAFQAQGYRPRDELAYVTYARPGRQVARFAMADDRTLFLFVYQTPAPGGTEPQDADRRKAAVRAVFGADGWETPQILQAMDAAPDIYLDRMSQIRMPAWTKGRVALLGDAASCPSLLAGEGSGLAMTQAYVLAGELAAAGGDPAVALPRYEARLRGFVAGKQESARKFAGYFAPKTAGGLWLRNAMMNLMNVPGVGEAFLRRDLVDDFDLPDYGI